MLILNPCIINQAPMYVYTAIFSFGISCSWQLCLGFVLIHKHILRWSWLIEFPVICLSVIPIWMFMISFAKYWISMVACSSYSHVLLSWLSEFPVTCWSECPWFHLLTWIFSDHMLWLLAQSSKHIYYLLTWVFSGRMLRFLASIL